MRFDLRVRARDLRPHERGTQIDMPEAYVVEVRFKLPLRIPGTAASSYDGRGFDVGAGDKPHLEGIVTPGRAP